MCSSVITQPYKTVPERAGPGLAAVDHHSHTDRVKNTVVYSLNVPVPGRVERVAADLYPRLTDFDRVRERHSLVCKRFESAEYHRLAERARRALAGAPAVEARIDGIDWFAEPVRGPGPVVYLAVESPGLYALHERLVGEFGAISDLEDTEYVPHVTLARGGSKEQARALCALDVDPVVWTISELVFWDHRRGERVGTIPLPAESL